MKFRHLDLFSGLGGNTLAAELVWGEQHETVAFCEIEPFPQAVLRYRWPGVPIHSDIRKLNGGGTGTIDLVTGGFPCQPFSGAGKRRGKDDDRDLWPEMFRVIREANPRWILGENVANFANMELARTVSDLEGEGYEVQSFVIPALAVGAPHRRDRVWIVGHRTPKDTNSDAGGRRPGQVREAEKIPGVSGETLRPGELGGTDSFQHASNAPSLGNRGRNHEKHSAGKRKLVAGEPEGSEVRSEGERRAGDVADSDRVGQFHRKPEKHSAKGRKHALSDFATDSWQESWPEVATALCGMDDGLPGWMDGVTLPAKKHREARIKALGNAIVPQVAVEIMRAMKEVDKQFHGSNR